MSRVDIVRRIFDDSARGDFHAAAGLFDPHALLVLREDFPESGVYHGPEEIAAYTRSLLTGWKDFLIEARDFVDAGDSVVAEVRQRGVGRSSGIATELSYFMVFSFRGDSIIRIESIAERADALATVGLRG